MTPAPRWFVPVAVLALLWNLLGCMAFAMDAMLTPQDVAKMEPTQQALYASRPIWAVAATALAVIGGAIGSLGLVLRRRWAFAMLVASLVGVVAQDIGLFVLSGVAVPPAVYAMQGVVLAVAIALVLLARRASARGWLR